MNLDMSFVNVKKICSSSISCFLLSASMTEALESLGPPKLHNSNLTALSNYKSLSSNKKYRFVWKSCLASSLLKIQNAEDPVIYTCDFCGRQ